MSQRRGTATDNLGHVLQVLQLGRKSGRLLIERNKGGQLETGEITFVNGQITQAKDDYATGMRALQHLNAWEACRFSFEPALSSLPMPPHTPAGPSPSGRIFFDSNSRLPATPRRDDTPVPESYTSPTPHAPVPHRVVQAEQALQLLDQAGLSRLHRRLFLLINGSRNTIELIRLLGRKPEEVQQLLHDLERAGIIRIY